MSEQIKKGNELNIDGMSMSGGGLGPAKAGNDLSNCEDRGPRFSFVMIVLNGMPFIEYSLKSVYDFAHEIIIIEGAVENCMFAANADGSSTDGTVEFIESFPDPQKKIRLVQGRWPEKCEMQNEALKHVTGNYVWLIDSDEVYKKEDLDKIKEILRSDPSITQVNFIPDSFWKGLDYIFVSSKFFEDSCHCRRLFKYVPGSMFTTHRPPTMVWPGHNKTTEQMNLLDGTATRGMGIIFYHYSYVLDKQVKQKVELYRRYGWDRHWKLDLDKWYEECFLRWTPQNRKQIDSDYPIWTGDIDSHTVLFNGTHPKVVIDYILNDAASSANRAAMQHVVNAVDEIKRSFPRQQIDAIETGTIRSFHEKHFSTYHISCALGNRASLISVDISADSIRISRQVCHGSRNVEFVHSDSIKYLKALKDIRFHFALLDSVNDKNHILEEFRLIAPMMVEGGILIVDDAGITRDGCRIDTCVAAQKGHLIWEFLRTCGVRSVVLETTFGHGTQLKIAMTRENLAKIERGLGSINRQTEGLSSISGLGDDAMSRSFVGNTRKSIVWVRTDSIGDAVLSSSMLPYIREKHQDAGITVVCQGHIAELYEACPYVDDIVAFDKKRALQDDRYREEIVMRLRALKPDVSLNSVYSREALTDWFALKCGAERRVALEGNLCNISQGIRDAHNEFYTEVLPSRGEYKLELERHEDFLRGLGVEVTGLQPMIWTTAEDETFAEKFFQDNGLNAGNTIALFPSAQHSWQVYEQYKSVLQDFDGFRFVILGDKDAEGYAGEICSGLPERCWNLAGRTTIRQTAAIIRRCCLYLGPDSAGAHIACAVGVPGVVILGGGHFGRFMPYSPLTSVVCLPLECYGCNWGCRYEKPHCVKDVAVEVVAEALRQSLAKSSHKIRVFMQGNSLWKPSAGQPAWKTAEQFLQTDNTEIISIEGRGDVIQWGRGSLDIHIAEPRRSPDVGWRSDVETLADDRLTIATSIAPKEIEKQVLAVKSWIKLGFRVVSINCPEEINVLRQSFQEVEFVSARRDARGLFGKPLIYFDDFLEYFRKTNCEFCGIVNSDVLLSGDEGIIPFIQGQAKGSLVYGSRTDVDSLEVLDGEVLETGFDFFFFDKSLISYFPESEFCLGVPWWDYWAPLIPALEGFQIKKLISPFAYHVRHSFKWDQEQWCSLAQKCFGYLLDRVNENFYEDPDNNALALLGQILSVNHNNDIRQNDRDARMLPGVFSESILEFLERKTLLITYAGNKPPVAQNAYDPLGEKSDAPVCKADSAIRCARDQAAQCDVSIVLCTKDRAELLDRMLSSLEQAARGVVYELIVIEGASSDNTLDVLRRHNVWHVYNESQHLGPGRHSWPELYNFGFSKARGKWAMYASDDIVFAPNSIARAVEMLDRQKEEVAGGVFFYKNLRPTRQEWAEYGIDFTHGNRLLLNYGLVRLDRFRECGGLEECYNFYCADTDLCYKLYEGGHELIPLGGCFVTHDNLLDVQKQANADASGRDIELCQRRWSHFVPTEIPSPTRLLWHDELAEAFDVPGELERIDSGIESFWRGLAYFGQAMFAEAERQFIQAVQSQCDHGQVLWYLALAADKCQDNAIVEKAATGVVRLAPDFEPALELLLRVTGTEQYSPDRALCSAGSPPRRVSPAYSYAGGAGPAEFHLDGRGWGGAEPADRAAPIATIRKMPRRSGPDHSEMELRREIGRFNKVVVWGLKTSEHTHAHIHRHFFDALRKLGAKAVFVDDVADNADAVESNDLVIAVDVAISHLPVTDGVYYCLHNCPDHIHRRITPARNIRLQTYMSSVEPASGGAEKWDDVTFFDSATRTLYQPWATDLLASEFKEPILNRSGGVVFWVGSVWDDDLGRGNINEIQTLKDVLEARGLRFIHLRGISDSLNVRYVRNSFIAPAIVGRWQMQNGYLPCRMWKNISYGQLGVSNVKKFDDVFDDCTVKGRSIEELIDNTLSLPFSTYRDMICRQQEIVKNRHTYVCRLLNIIRAFDSVENH